MGEEVMAEMEGKKKDYRITKGAPMASSFSYCPNCGAKMDGAAE